MDLGFSGHPFTWNNRQYGRSFIYERLDRALANMSWYNCFPNTKNYHLASSTSDHNPILLDTHHTTSPRRKHFRYEKVWSNHESSANVVAKSWASKVNPNSNNDFQKFCSIFRSKASWWKRNIFGNLNRNIESIMDKIEKHTLELDINYSTQTHEELNRLINQHQFLLKQKEIFWKQRSRVLWLIEGDNNTKFFHAYATNRKHTNTIHSLKLNNQWIYKLEDIQKSFLEHFKTISTSSKPKPSIFQNICCHLEEHIPLTKNMLSSALAQTRLLDQMTLMGIFSKLFGTL
ncbi:hypothetical protein ACP275_14G207000 [Erythranthe tilingii]